MAIYFICGMFVGIIVGAVALIIIANKIKR